MSGTPGWLGLYVIAALLAAGGMCAPARGEDAGAASREDTLSLQRRLTDAGCYKGAINGSPSAALDIAVKACPDQRPRLRIETGMHTQSISAIGVDTACDLAVTGSDDGTARVWTLPDGRLLRTVRPPIDENDSSEIFAAAMSPDGRTAAISRRDVSEQTIVTYAIYVFDTRLGDALRRIGSFGGPVSDLAFSPDGRQLAAGMSPYKGTGAGSDGGKLRLFDVASGRQLASDPDFRSGVTGISFAANGDLYAKEFNGDLRRYDRTLKQLSRATVDDPGLSSSTDTAVEPGGGRVAIGYQGFKPVIKLVDSRSLSVVGKVEPNSYDLFSKLAWARDGLLVAVQGGNPKLFDFEHRRITDIKRLSRHGVTSLRTCGEGVAFASRDPSFGVVHRDGEAVIFAQDRVPDMTHKDGDALEVSDDGRQVRFGLDAGGARPIRFDLATGTISDAGTDVSPSQASELHPADRTGLPLRRVKGMFGVMPGSEQLNLNGKMLISEFETVEGLAIRPDRQGLVVQGTNGLHSFDSVGNQRWLHTWHGSPSGVNFARGGDLIVLSFLDGTIRWHRWSDGAELLSLFVDAKTKRFVAWTPTGYYMASPGGEDLIGWHVNRGWNQAADFFPASRFRDRFNRPDVVELVLDTLDEGAAVQQANAKAHRREETKPLVAELPPLIRIVDPLDGGRVATAEAKIDYVWRSPSALPVDGIEVSIDGRPVKEETTRVAPADANAEVKGSLKIALPPHDVEVGLIAYSGDIKSEVAAVKLTWTGPVPPTAPPRRLHALIAGVSDYAAPEMALAYAAKDARDFAHALESQKGGYYAEVETRVIVDRDVTRASLIDGLDWLSKQAGPDDVSVLFLAGHGVTDENLNYWYLPSDATEEQAHGKGLSQDDVQRALRNASGRVVWFLDTCHAGGATTRSAVDVNRLMNTVTSAENGGIVAFASSQGNETSFESSVWKNGAFTKALVDGIEHGQAAPFSPNIKISVLEDYLEARVAELTDHAQTPTMHLPPQATDFIIARAKKEP